MFQRNDLVVLGLMGFAALGCSKETTSSANIKTGGFATLIDVYADNDATSRVHVELKVGGSSSNTSIALENGDKLTATNGDAKKTLTVSSESGIYEANFDGVAEDTVFTVALERTDETVTSTGKLPAPFILDKPVGNLSRKADNLQVDWAPADTGDAVKLEASGDCIFEYSKAISDTGSHVIPKNSLDSTGGDMPTTCDLTLTLDRKRSGVADSDFDPESYMLLHQRRSVSVTSLP